MKAFLFAILAGLSILTVAAPFPADSTTLDPTEVADVMVGALEDLPGAGDGDQGGDLVRRWWCSFGRVPRRCDACLSFRGPDGVGSSKCENPLTVNIRVCVFSGDYLDRCIVTVTPQCGNRTIYSGRGCILNPRPGGICFIGECIA